MWMRSGASLITSSRGITQMAADAANRYRQPLLDQVISRQAALIAMWQFVGLFMRDEYRQHVDRGRDHRLRPCAFMTCITPRRSTAPLIRWDATPTATSQASPSGTSSIWRRRCVCRACQKTTMAAVKEAQEAIDEFAKTFETAYAEGLSRKLGLFQSRPGRYVLAQGPVRSHGSQQRRFHLGLPPSVRRGGRP